MKTAGIVRIVDKSGRFGIPKKMRGVLGIKEGSKITVQLEGDELFLKKYETGVNRNEKYSVLANLQTMIELEENHNVKETLVRAVHLIKGDGRIGLKTTD